MTLGFTLSFTVTGGDLPDGTVLNLGATTLTVGTDSHSSTAGQEQWNLRTLGLSLDLGGGPGIDGVREPAAGCWRAPRRTGRRWS